MFWFLRKLTTPEKIFNPFKKSILSGKEKEGKEKIC